MKYLVFFLFLVGCSDNIFQTLDTLPESDNFLIVDENFSEISPSCREDSVFTFYTDSLTLIIPLPLREGVLPVCPTCPTQFSIGDYQAKSGTILVWDKMKSVEFDRLPFVRAADDRPIHVSGKLTCL